MDIPFGRSEYFCQVDLLKNHDFYNEDYVCNQLSQVVQHVKMLFETHVTYNHNLNRPHSNEPIYVAI